MGDLNSWLFLLIGLIGGFLLSAYLWWLTNHYFVPDLQFSEKVSRSEAKFLESGVRFQIAFKNSGKRDAYQVKFKCKMKIKDILRSGGKLWDFMNIALTGDEFYILKKGSMFRLTPRPELTAEFLKPIYTQKIRERCKNKSLTFDDFFDEYKEVRIYIEAIGIDSVSGGIKYFRSKEYSKDDFMKGVFHGRDHQIIHQYKNKE